MSRRARAAIALVGLSLALGALWVATRTGACHPRDPIASLERAAARSPEDAQVLHQLGRALLEAGRPLEARPHLERALALGVDSAEARVGLALAYEELGHYPEAIEHAHAALRLAPDRVDAELALARILATCPDPELRDVEEAVRLADRARARAVAPDVDLLEALAAVYAAAGRPDEARRASQEALLQRERR